MELKEKYPTKEFYEKIKKVVDRYATLVYIESGGRITLNMDIENTLTEKEIDRLLNFDNENFKHDVFGIIYYIDRDTGKLKNCFVPRCAGK